LSLFSGIAKIIAGAALIAGAVVVEYATLGAASGAIFALVTSGVGMIVSGAGTLIAGDPPVKGFATVARNPVAPWRILYGRNRVGGTIVYLNMWGSNSKVLDMVVVIAAHPCLSVDELLFNQQRIQIDSAAAPSGAQCAGTSFTPVQQTVNLASIVRNLQGVVTVTVNSDIPYLSAGDQIIIQNVTTDATLNGIFSVGQITNAPSTHVNGPVGTGALPLKFTFLNGGSYHTAITSQGQAKTKWADYGRTVYMEALLGAQTLGQTFKGMTTGTPYLGSGPNVRPEAPGPAGSGGPGPTTLLGGTLNPWTTSCSLQGKTAVFLRLTYVNDANGNPFYVGGIPQISFHVRGKNDILDTRTSGHGYTENAALCIADFLAAGNSSSPTASWGFKADYGTDIPTAPLNAAADICDQAVTLAIGGTEPRYALNGQFETSMRRGEILQNMLTACAGRLTAFGGQFIIQPGYWTGGSAPAVDLKALASGPFVWRPVPTGREVYNGVKGTFISPENKWQSTDFPYYAEDTVHGFGSDSLLTADGGDRRWLDIQLPFTISYATAQRIAKIELLRRRHWGTGTFPLNMAGYQFAPLDIISATHSVLGWSGKAIEITGARLRAEKQGDVVLLGTEIEVQETDAAVYAWSTSEELSPQGYQETTPPTWSGSPALAAENAPYPWSPGYVSPLAGDAIGGPASFGVQPEYALDAQGNSAVSLDIKGTTPVNSLDEIIGPPVIACTVGTSGSLGPGNYTIGLSALDASGSPLKNAPFFNLVTVTVPSGGNGSITVTPTWSSGDVGGELYVATGPTGPFHYNQAMTVGQTAATITTFDQSTSGGPDIEADHLSVVWQDEIHAGDWAQQVQAVTPTTITIASLTAGDVAANQWAGCVLSLLAKFDPTVEVPILNMPVASHTASSGTPAEFVITIGPNSSSVQLPDLTTLLEVGDLVVMRSKATFTASTITNANFANCYFPSGMVGVESGHQLLMITGAAAGNTQTIDSVTSGTTINLAGTFPVTPATGDLFVILGPQLSGVEGAPFTIPNRSSGAAVQLSPDVSNIADHTWFFRVRVESVTGAIGADNLTPFREIYIFGGLGTTLLTASGSQSLRFSTYQFDTSLVTGTTDTLSASILSTDLTLTATSGTDIIAGTVIQIGTEKLFVTDDTANPIFTVTRGWNGTTAAAHSSGDTISVGASLDFFLMAAADCPNVTLTLNKVSGDINYVKYSVAGGSGDTLPGGGTSGILADNDTLATEVIKIPGS